jgi:hypothetical protein
VAKRLPRNQRSNIERELELLRTELRQCLLPTLIRSDAVTREIEKFLVRWGDKPPIRRLIAKQLATHLASKWPFASTRSVEPSIETEVHEVLAQSEITPAIAKKIAERLMDKWAFVSVESIERVIQNRPELLDQAFSASTHDEMQHLLKVLPNLLSSRRKRTKPSSNQERAERIAKSKRRYDRHRPYKQTTIGSIEREFGEPQFLLTDPLGTDPPWGPCLDSLINGAEVKMSGEIDSLKTLF